MRGNVELCADRRSKLRHHLDQGRENGSLPLWMKVALNFIDQEDDAALRCGAHQHRIALVFEPRPHQYVCKACYSLHSCRSNGEWNGSVRHMERWNLTRIPWKTTRRLCRNKRLFGGRGQSFETSGKSIEAILMFGN